MSSVLSIELISNEFIIRAAEVMAARGARSEAQ